jgi:hypothetical protein
MCRAHVVIYTAHNHSSFLERAFDHEQSASVCDPTLMPRFSGGVVNTEALTFRSVRGLIILMHDAAIENAIDSNPRDRGGWFVGVKGIPITKPEIKLSIFGPRTSR